MLPLKLALYSSAPSFFWSNLYHKDHNKRERFCRVYKSDERSKSVWNRLEKFDSHICKAKIRLQSEGNCISEIETAMKSLGNQSRLLN